MLSAAYDGKTSDQRPTVRYLLHKWRRLMSASWADLLQTPLDVILADLEYISIEREMRAKKEKQLNNGIARKK